MKTLIPLFVGLVIATGAEARQYRKLTRIVNENVTAISQAMEKNSDDEAMLFNGNFELKRLLLRFQAKAGFDVEFGKVELVPEIELVFQKEKS